MHQKNFFNALELKHDALSVDLLDLQRAHSEALAERRSAQESHARALETQDEIEQKYSTLLKALEADTATLEQDKQAALNELVALKKELQDEVDQLKSELAMKDEAGSAGITEATKKYETLLAERDSAEKDHEAAVTLLRDSLREDHERTLSELQSKYDTLQKQIAKANQEHEDAMELLKEEFKAGHSNDMQSLKQQLDVMQKQHAHLVEQKAAMEKAHEDAISDLMTGIEANASDATQRIQRKYDALAAELKDARLSHLDELDVARDAHVAELETAKGNLTEQQILYRDLLSRHDKASADVEAHAEDVKRLMETIHKVEGERDRAVKSAEGAEDRIETMKGEAVRKHLARVEPLEKENALLHDKVERLEAILAVGDRVARSAASMGEQRNIVRPC